jgi:hypothetical protein
MLDIFSVLTAGETLESTDLNRHWEYQYMYFMSRAGQQFYYMYLKWGHVGSHVELLCVY